MLKDRIENIGKYNGLDEALKSFSLDKLSSPELYSFFIVDKNKTTLFYVEKGEVDFATSWRDNENNREVLAVIKAEAGEFVLYLPGEPYTYKKTDDSFVEIWK